MALSPTTSRGSGGVTVLSYVEYTSNVTISATTEAAGNTIVTAASVAASGGTLLCVEFYSAAFQTGAGANLLCQLWQDSAPIGTLGALFSFQQGAFLARRYLTPSAGNYVYSVRAYRATANATITAGAGGAAAYMPGYIRITSGG